MAISDLRFGSLDESLLESFEAFLGSKLPSEYRFFLQSSNGGRVTPNALKNNSFPDTLVVDVLFALGVERDFDLRAWREQCRDELPSNMLVIGGDPFGNLFVLGLESSAVYFWDCMKRFHYFADEANTFLIGETFTSFIQNLVQDTGMEIIGPLGSKRVQNIWHHSKGGQMQEINRLSYLEFSAIDPFIPSSA